MAGQISQGALSPSQVTAPGLYVQVLPPPSFVSGVPTNVGAVSGSASWGPVNIPQYCGSPGQLISTFGPIGTPTAFGAAIGTTLPSNGNPYDMIAEALAVFSQATGRGSLGLWCTRGVDGANYTQGGTPGTGGTGQNTTGAYAAYILHDSGAVAGLTFYGLYMGTLGNGITITTAVGSKGAGFTTVTINPPGGLGLNAEVYPNVPTAAGNFGGTAYASLFWPTIQSWMANGIPNGRGPSQLIFSYANSSSGTGKASTTAVANATVSAVALTGGIDGDTNVTGGYAGTQTLPANLIGSNAAFPVTGLYTLQNLNPPVAGFRLAGYGEAATDVTATGTTVDAICNLLAAFTVAGFPIGDDSATATAVTQVVTNAVDDYQFIYVKDHASWNDGTSGPRFFPMAPFALGSILTLAPQNSPLNTGIQSIIGTYRDVSAGAPAPYSTPEIGACNTGRISLIAKPCPGGVYEGWNTAVNASSNPATYAVEYTTLTNYIAKSLANAFGKYVGPNQSPNNPQDLQRNGVRDELNRFLQQLVQSQTIVSGYAICDLTNNTPTTIAQHFLFASAFATYFSSVWYFLLSFTGGTTVAVRVTQGTPS